MPRLLSLQIADSAQAWADCGFAVDRASGSPTVWLGGIALELAPDETDLSTARRGITSWHLTEVEGHGALAGLPAGPAPVAAPDPGPLTEHPNSITAVDHVVVAAADLDATCQAFTDAGLSPRGTRDTTAGGQPMRQVFFVVETSVIEMIGSPGASQSRAQTNGPDSSMSAPSLDSATFWGLALVTTDMDNTAATLGDGLGQPKDAVQPGRAIATLRHRHFDMSVRTAVMTERTRGQA